MASKKEDPDATLPGRSFGHIELEIGPDVNIGPRAFHGIRSEDVTHASERTRAAVGDPRVAAMRELYAEGDANGALFIALSIAPTASAGLESPAAYEGWIPTYPKTPVPPDDDRTLLHRPAEAPPRARSWGGAPRRLVPRVLRSNDEIAAMPIDHRGGFLLAHVDGIQTIDEILDVCAMSEDEAFQLLEQLAAMGAITLESGEPTPAPGSRRPR